MQVLCRWSRYLTNDSRYADAAYRSVARLYNARTPLGLVGKHIHIQSGSWTEASSGIGYNVDSFYEYLLKSSILFGDPRYKTMFSVMYSAVENRLRNGDWYTGPVFPHLILFA